MHEDIEELYISCYPELHRFLSRHCKDHTVVDDLIQATFLEALKSMESYHHQSSLKTWLFAIAKHQLYRHYRKHAKDMEADTRIGVQMIQEDHAHTALLANEIIHKVNALTQPQRDIMRLRLLYGLSFKELGIKIGQTENYCRVYYYRIKEKLRKELHYDDV